MKIEHRVYHCEVAVLFWDGDIGKIEPVHHFKGSAEEVQTWAEEKVKDGSIDNFFGVQKVLGAFVSTTVHEVLDSGHEKEQEWEQFMVLNGITEDELREIVDA